MSVRFEMRVADAQMAAIDAARGSEPRAAWIKRALDAALSEGQAEDSGSRPASPSRSSASRRASGERARPAAAAGGGAIESPSGPGHASSAQVKRGVKPIPKATR